jgi:predicted small metal-binding protein
MGSLTCKELGIDCSFTTTGTTEQEIMRQFIAHTESAHKMPVLSAEIMYRVQKTIKSENLFVTLWLAFWCLFSFDS